MRKPIVQSTACATIIFWNGSSGVLSAPPAVCTVFPSVGFDRSRVSGPESMCMISVAPGSLSPGLFVPNAQMMSWFRLLPLCGAAWVRQRGGTATMLAGGAGRQGTGVRTGIVNEKFALPVTDVVALSVVAIRGGLETRVGMTSAGACRCESVTEPSALAHMMTMGVSAICFPKPLQHVR